MPDIGWVTADELLVSDSLVTLDGKTVAIEQISHEYLDSPETTYNFEVEGFHTYYVGDIGVPVHNACKHKEASWRKQKSDYWKANADVPSDLYDLTSDNVALMQKGKAPIGFDGNRIELHHVKGISNSTEIRPMTKASHAILHKLVGFSNMADYSF